MTPAQASKAAAALGVLLQVGAQVNAAQAKLQQALAEGRDITDDELDQAHAAAQAAIDALAKG